MGLRFPADFECRDGIYAPRGAATDFAYSDGDDTERYIHEAIRSARDRSTASTELERWIKDWPTLYHLSRKRANLLRPLDLRRFGRVLEIGCGCGAITRYLGETCASVTALEGSPRRLAIARDRCEGLPNVTFVRGNFNEVRFDRPFDLVTVIGVWEYAGAYTEGEGDPWLRFLQRARSVLAPDGVLAIAIENQLGLKYFGGAPEDHTARAWEGIEGYYPGTRVRTFGRKVVEDYLAGLGLVARFYLPFPDYKLPKLLVNAGALREDVAISDWYDAAATPRHFVDPLVRPELERNGLLVDTANSFLILAAARQTALPSPPWLVTSYALDRAKCYQTETQLRASAGGGQVVKRALFPDVAAEPDAPFHQSLAAMPFVRGEKLALRMLRAWRIGGPAAEAAFHQLVQQWHAFLRRHASADAHGASARLPGDFIDCTPFNLVVNDGTMEFIDREWVDGLDRVTVGWVLFRGLYWFLSTYSNQLPSHCRPGRWSRLIRRQLQQLGYPSTDADLLQFAEREAAFQRTVLGSAEAGQADVAVLRRHLKSSRLNAASVKRLGARSADLAYRAGRKALNVGCRRLFGVSRPAWSGR